MVVSKRPKSSYGSKSAKPKSKPKSKSGGMLKKTVVMPRTTKSKIVKVEIAVKPSKPMKKSSRSKTSKTVRGKGFVAGRMTKKRTVAKRRTRIVRK